MVVRLKNKENLTTAHRRHLYQLLANECKISHWKISAGYGLLQFLIGISIVLLKDMGLIMVISALVFFVCFFTIFSIMLRRKIHRFA
jgi:Fuc2NAc and GlcNAc transferase